MEYGVWSDGLIDEPITDDYVTLSTYLVVSVLEKWFVLHLPVDIGYWILDIGNDSNRARPVLSLSEM